MTDKQFDAAYSAFAKRRPFLPFLIEFTSGGQVLVSHPEAVRRRVELYVMRLPDGGHVVFVPESVTRLLDPSE